MDSETASTVSSSSEEISNLVDTTFGNTSLHYATDQGDFEQTKELLQDGIQTEKKNFFGETSLLTPTIRGDVKIFSLLVEYGADIDANLEPLHLLTTNPRIHKVAGQAHELDNAYKESMETPNNRHFSNLKSALSIADKDIWDPYKRLALKIGEDANSSNPTNRTNAKRIFSAIASDINHTENMLLASKEVSKRQINQGNDSLHDLVTNNTPTNRWQRLFNRKVSNSHTQALESNETPSRSVL